MVLMRVLFDASRSLRLLRSETAFAMHALLDSALRSILEEDLTQMIRYPSADGHGASVVHQRSSG